MPYDTSSGSDGRNDDPRRMTRHAPGIIVSLAGFDHFGSAPSRVMTGSTSLQFPLARSASWFAQKLPVGSVASSDLATASASTEHLPRDPIYGVPKIEPREHGCEDRSRIRAWSMMLRSEKHVNLSPSLRDAFVICSRHERAEVHEPSCDAVVTRDSVA